MIEKRKLGEAEGKPTMPVETVEGGEFTYRRCDSSGTEIMRTQIGSGSYLLDAGS